MNKTHTSVVRTLVAFLVGSISIARAQPSNNSNALSPEQALARDVFRELIEINTTVNNGSTRAAEAMARRLRAAGFPESDLHLVGPHPANQNLVARFRGKGNQKPVLLIGHLDVVEARREDWSFDPFSFIEKDGFFYGRGTSDMKCEDADIIANFIRLKKEGFVPQRDLILALTEDEETGDANGVEWLLAHERSLIDAEFAINLEGGGGDIKGGKRKVMDVQTSEKVFVSFQLEVKNPGGHSSLPVKENAIYRLAGGLTRLARFEFPFVLNETTRMYFERAAREESGRTRDDMLAILNIPIDIAAARRLSDSSAYYNALLRTTMVATMLSAGHAENALPQSARAVVNCRMLPGDSLNNVLSVLKHVLADSLILVTTMNEPFPSPVSSIRQDVFGTVEKLTSSMWPGVIVTPIMSTGASDGKYLRHVGIPVYGVSGIFADIDDVRAHGKDERIGVKEFYEGVEFMYRFVRTL